MQFDSKVYYIEIGKGNKCKCCGKSVKDKNSFLSNVTFVMLSKYNLLDLDLTERK